ncbi:hypothetical protein, partial [Burkholderia multivorans]
CLAILMFFFPHPTFKPHLGPIFKRALRAVLQSRARRARSVRPTERASHNDTRERNCIAPSIRGTATITTTVGDDSC